MSSSFDPYYVWLGIPPKHQPPNHYRLLGIELYEDNPDVIDAAANRQTSYLHDMASGPNRKHSQQLLNEIAGARRSLLDVDRKQKYDLKLRKEFESGTSAVADSDANGETASDDSGPASSAENTASKETDKSSGKPSRPSSLKLSASSKKSSKSEEANKNTEPDAPEKKKNNYAPAIIGVAGVVCLVIIIVVIMSGGDDQSNNTVTGVKPDNKQSDGTKADDSKSTNNDAADDKQPQHNVDKDLLAYYRFEESAERGLDETPHLRQASFQGDPKFVAGPIETAVQLDGKDDVMSVPQSSVNPQQGSASFWLRIDSAQMPNRVGLMQANGQKTKFALALVNGRIVAAFGASKDSLQTTSVLEPGHWYHIAVSWEARKNVTVFCNGKKIGEAFLSGINVRQAIKFGAERQKGSMTHSAVSLDDVQFSQRTLDESQLKILMTDAKVSLKTPKIVAIAKVKPIPAPVQKDPKKVDPKKVDPPPRKIVKIEEPKGKSEVLLEYWQKIPGKNVNELTKRIKAQPNPDGFRHLNQLSSAGGPNLGDQFGQRVRGFLVPPVEGTYKFSLAFDDQGKFFLLTGTSSAGLKEIPNNGTRHLNADRTYYFEILHKEEKGTENFNIGWTRPDGAVDATIGAQHLTWKPYYRSFVTLPIQSIVSQPKMDFTAGKDHSQIAIGGNVKIDSTYTVKAKLTTGGLSAIRFEALPHESLTKNGPGLGLGGKFAIQEFKVSYSVPGKPDVSIRFQPPLADSSAATAKNLTDDNPDSTWTIPSSRADRKTGVMLILEKPLSLPMGTTLTFSIQQRYNVGRFRLRVTDMEPSSLITAAKRFEELANRKETKYLNLGGTRSHPIAGKTWAVAKKYTKKGDTGYVGGKSITVPANQVANAIQRSAIEGITEFHAKVPNGLYKVQFFFSENWKNAQNQRVFRIKVQDLKPVDVDVFVQAGGARKLLVSNPQRVQVKDGALRVVFTKQTGEPILNGISIEEQ